MKSTTLQERLRLKNAEANPSSVIYKGLAVSSPMSIPERIRQANNTIEEQLRKDPLGQESTALIGALEELLLITQQTGSYIGHPSQKWIENYLLRYQEETYDSLGKKYVSSEQKMQLIGYEAAHEYRAESCDILANFHNPNTILKADPRIILSPATLLDTAQKSMSYKSQAESDRLIAACLRPRVEAAPSLPEEVAPIVEEEPVQKQSSAPPAKLSVSDYIARGTKYFAEGKMKEGLKDFAEAMQKEPDNPQARFGAIYASLKKNRDIEATVAEHPDFPALEVQFTRRQRALLNPLKQEIQKAQKKAQVPAATVLDAPVITPEEVKKADATIVSYVQILDEKDTEGWKLAGGGKGQTKSTPPREQAVVVSAVQQKPSSVPPKTKQQKPIIAAAPAQPVTVSIPPASEDLQAFPPMPSSKVLKATQQKMKPTNAQGKQRAEEIIPVPVAPSSLVTATEAEQVILASEATSPRPVVVPVSVSVSERKLEGSPVLTDLVSEDTSEHSTVSSTSTIVYVPVIDTAREAYLNQWQQQLIVWQQQLQYAQQPPLTEMIRARLSAAYHTREALPHAERTQMREHARASGNKDVNFLLDAYLLLEKGVLSTQETALLCARVFPSQPSISPPILLSNPERWPKGAEWKTFLNIAPSVEGKRTPEATNFVRNHIVPCLATMNPTGRKQLLGHAGKELFELLSQTAQGRSLL